MKISWILSLSALTICVLLAGCTSGGTVTTPMEQEPTPAVPIYANQIQEGTYSINVTSSSSMFRIIDAQLTVKGGKMSAVITLSGVAYLKLYLGTSEEALEATDDDYIYYVENSEGKYTYEVPVEALDKGMDCAAWSKNTEKWYDRVLVFKSTMIPKEALISP